MFADEKAAAESDLKRVSSGRHASPTSEPTAPRAGPVPGRRVRSSLTSQRQRLRPGADVLASATQPGRDAAGLEPRRRDSNPAYGTRAGVSSALTQHCEAAGSRLLSRKEEESRLPGAGWAFVPTLSSVSSLRAIVAAGISAGVPRCAGTESSLGCRGGNLTP